MLGCMLYRGRASVQGGGEQGLLVPTDTAGPSEAQDQTDTSLKVKPLLPRLCVFCVCVHVCAFVPSAAVEME